MADAHWCPVCGRATPDRDRCHNHDCGADLSDRSAPPVVPDDAVPPTIRRARARFLMRQSARGES